MVLENRKLPVLSGVRASWRPQPVDCSTTVDPALPAAAVTPPYTAMPIIT